MKDQCKSCAKWRRCKDRSRGVACAEYKKPLRNWHSYKGHKEIITYMITENVRKGKENENERKNKQS